MQKFTNLSPDLRKAVETIRFECISHKTCAECPFSQYKNTVGQRCGLKCFPEDWWCENET